MHVRVHVRVRETRRMLISLTTCMKVSRVRFELEVKLRACPPALLVTEHHAGPDWLNLLLGPRRQRRAAANRPFKTRLDRETDQAAATSDQWGEKDIRADKSPPSPTARPRQNDPINLTEAEPRPLRTLRSRGRGGRGRASAGYRFLPGPIPSSAPHPQPERRLSQCGGEGEGLSPP